MLDWNKQLPATVSTDDGATISTLSEAVAYAQQKSSQSWKWAKRQLTRAALSTDAEDLKAALIAVQNAICLDGMGQWKARKRA